VGLSGMGFGPVASFTHIGGPLLEWPLSCPHHEREEAPKGLPQNSLLVGKGGAKVPVCRRNRIERSKGRRRSERSTHRLGLRTACWLGD